MVIAWRWPTNSSSRKLYPSRPGGGGRPPPARLRYRHDRTALIADEDLQRVAG